MARKKDKQQNIVLKQVVIADWAAEGKCVARVDGQVVFVDHAVPGDIADLQVVYKKKNYMEAVPVHFHKYSSLRTEPFCQHFGICGGCKWQNLDYGHQLQYKQQQVIDSLQRIGKVELHECRPILGSEQTRYYRNKLEFTFSNKRWLQPEEMDKENPGRMDALGFHVPKRFDKILDIENCYLQPSPSNDIRRSVREFARANNLSFFDIKAQHGLLRNLIVRTGNTGDVMVIVLFFENDMDAIGAVMNHLKDKFPQITSLLYVVNPKGNETFHDLEVVTYHGKPYLTERMEDLEFRVGPKSFFQTNSTQAYELYKIARNFAGLTGQEIVYDLYTGTGTIANFVAKRAKRVIGLEYVPMAIEDARINSQLNNIHNTLFYAGDIKDLLNDRFLSEHDRPDVIITDPPRAGMHEEVVKMLMKIEAPRVVYVSCNPATQARDLGWMDEKYAVKIVQPVDMFPHTHHVENVVLLELRK